MMEYHYEITETFKVFFHLKRTITASVKLLKDHAFDEYAILGIKSLYIDIYSFIEEFNAFKTFLMKVDETDLMAINRFLLLTDQCGKLLNKKDQTIGKFRNTVYAHNYRKKAFEYVDHFRLTLDHFENAPILDDEMYLLAEAVLLICDIADECFRLNSDSAYFELKRQSDLMEKIFPLIQEEKLKLSSLSIKQIRKEVFYIKDELKSHPDNYKIISKKIKCKIRM